MAIYKKARLSSLMSVRPQPWPPSTAIAPRLNPTDLVEEENTPFYSPETFYPARLGQVLQGRYQLATKLGYGSSSTVWLARDLYRWRWTKEKFVALKIAASNHYARDRGVPSELATLRQIAEANPRHEGWRLVRKLIDSFTIPGARGSHTCLVFEPMREPLWLYKRRYIGAVIPSEILKIIVQMILHGLDYLHNECHLIHTDLKPGNVMVKLENLDILERAVREEYEYPLPQKHVEDRIIYLSRSDYGQMESPTGIIQLVDFDLSVSGDVPRSGTIQADVYRAPEVTLDVGYTYSADIWSLGVMLWNLLEGKDLFDATVDPKNAENHDEDMHLALITALLGPRPDQLAGGQRTSMFYESNGTLRKANLIPKDFSFESTVRNVSGEEKQRFINFAKRMIKWLPEERSTAKELLDDPWLYTDFPQD